MPITGPSSYLPTTDEFIAHWTNANAELGAGGPILLTDGVDVEFLQSLRDTLAGQRTQVEVARNDAEDTRAQLTSLKAALLERMAQFRNKVRSLSDDPRWEAMMPKAYGVTESAGKVVPPLDDMADLWGRFNADAGTPMTLMGGYAVAAFELDLATLKNFFTSATNAVGALKLARASRNQTQEQIYPILKQYRQRIPAEFPEGNAVLETLPRLTPLPGSTPDAVDLSGSWDATEEKAALAWSEVTDASVTTLQLRATAGPEYEADDESVIADFPAATDPRETLQTFGLGVPGAAASFKLYSLTAEGNERGSNTVTIERPATP